MFDCLCQESEIYTYILSYIDSNNAKLLQVLTFLIYSKIPINWKELYYGFDFFSKIIIYIVWYGYESMSN